jgi:hypothetical protein
MAKVKGPMHSDSAGGQFGKNMIFRSGKKGTVVTKYYKPGSAKKFTLSEAQIAQRTKYGEAVEAWRALTNEEREIFNENAKAQNISGWNLYFKNYFGDVPPPPPGWDFDLYNGSISSLQTIASGLGATYRLPTKDELYDTLFDKFLYAVPGLPDFAKDTVYWTSTPYDATRNYALAWNDDDGLYTFYDLKTDEHDAFFYHD